MVKQVGLTDILVVLMPFLLVSCASPTNDTLSGPSASQSAASVPGEKMSDDSRYSPGAMGAGNVRW